MSYKYILNSHILSNVRFSTNWQTTVKCNLHNISLFNLFIKKMDSTLLATLPRPSFEFVQCRKSNWKNEINVHPHKNTQITASYGTLP